MQHDDPDIYLALAVECLRKARYESSDRWMYVALANAWVSLADRADVEAFHGPTDEGQADADGLSPNAPRISAPELSEAGDARH